MLILDSLISSNSDIWFSLGDIDSVMFSSALASTNKNKQTKHQQSVTEIVIMNSLWTTFSIAIYEKPKHIRN